MNPIVDEIQKQLSQLGHEWVSMTFKTVSKTERAVILSYHRNGDYYCTWTAPMRGGVFRGLAHPHDGLYTVEAEDDFIGRCPPHYKMVHNRQTRNFDKIQFFIAADYMTKCGEIPVD